MTSRITATLERGAAIVFCDSSRIHHIAWAVEMGPHGGLHAVELMFGGTLRHWKDVQKYDVVSSPSLEFEAARAAYFQDRNKRHAAVAASAGDSADDDMSSQSDSDTQSDTESDTNQSNTESDTDQSDSDGDGFCSDMKSDGDKGRSPPVAEIKLPTIGSTVSYFANGGQLRKGAVYATTAATNTAGATVAVRDKCNVSTTVNALQILW